MHLRVGLASGPDHTPSVTCGGGGPPARALAHGRECTRRPAQANAGCDAVTGCAAAPAGRGGIRGRHPLTRIGSDTWSMSNCSNAPMSMRPSSIRRAWASPTASLVRRGGSKAGNTWGVGNGKRRRRGRSVVARIQQRTAGPRTEIQLRQVGEHRVAAAQGAGPFRRSPALHWPAPSCWNRPPCGHRTRARRLCGPQYGVSTLLAGFSRTMFGALPDAGW